MKRDKVLIGRQEWCALPELHIKRMRAKIDTGAKTSALHAENIRAIKRSGKTYVQFLVEPFSNEIDNVRQCEVLVKDVRYITSSNSTKEERFIINTDLIIGGITQQIELSLTSRKLMRFNILLGREALNKFAIIDPSKKYILSLIGEMKA